MKIIKILKKKKDKIKKYFEKIDTNYRWEVRYNNAMKKIEEKDKEIAELKDKLDNDLNVIRIQNLEAIKHQQKKIISNLREDNKRLMGI